jgi:hypothetical protein
MIYLIYFEGNKSVPFLVPFCSSFVESIADLLNHANDLAGEIDSTVETVHSY